MRPADRATTSGSTNVGGLLDLDGDGTYDYNDQDGNKEYYYGQCTGTPTNASDPYGVDPESAPLVNVNGVTDTSAASTFLAKHHKVSKIINNLNEITPKVAEYETFGTVNPSVVNGEFVVGDTGIPITRTDGPTGVGYATFSIYIEGWDHSVIDKTAGYSFNLDLKFEINRID